MCLLFPCTHSLLCTSFVKHKKKLDSKLSSFLPQLQAPSVLQDIQPPTEFGRRLEGHTSCWSWLQGKRGKKGMLAGLGRPEAAPEASRLRHGTVWWLSVFKLWLWQEVHHTKKLLECGPSMRSGMNGRKEILSLNRLVLRCASVAVEEIFLSLHVWNKNGKTNNWLPLF